MTEYDDDLKAGDDWRNYKRLILNEQQRATEAISKLSQKVEKLIVEDIGGLKTDIALLKFKAALWGTVGGSVFGALVTALFRTWIK